MRVEEREEDLSADKIVEAYMSLLRHDLRAYDARETLLLADSKAAEAKAKELIKLEFEGESLKLAVERQKELFNATVERLHEINLAKDYGGFVTEPIRAPTKGIEVWPSLPRIGAIGTIVGLILAAAIAVVLELQYRSVRSIEDVEQYAGTTVISAIPRLTEHLEPEVREAIKATGSPVAPSVVTFYQPGSRESEIFRGLRTTMLFRQIRSRRRCFPLLAQRQEMESPLSSRTWPLALLTQDVAFC